VQSGTRGPSGRWRVVVGVLAVGVCVCVCVVCGSGLAYACRGIVYNVCECIMRGACMHDRAVCISMKDVIDHVLR
jgi:hypothetical protein